MLDAIESELAVTGAMAINIKEVCEKINITPSLVNYHFGSVDAALAEAAVTSYERYVESNFQAVAKAPRDPESRLRAWIWSQFDWTITHPGIAAILNYGVVSPGVGNEIAHSETHVQRLSEWGTKNILLATTLMHDLRKNVITEGLLDPEAVLSDPDLISMTTLMTWSTLGFSTWASGRHSPTWSINDFMETKKLIESTVDLIIQTATAHR